MFVYKSIFNGILKMNLDGKMKNIFYGDIIKTKEELGKSHRQYFVFVKKEEQKETKDVKVEKEEVKAEAKVNDKLVSVKEEENNEEKEEKEDKTAKKTTRKSSRSKK